VQSTDVSAEKKQRNVEQQCLAEIALVEGAAEKIAASKCRVEANR
jgi:hypothetical protein